MLFFTKFHYSIMFGFGQNLFDAIFQENHILSRKIIEESRKGFEKKGFFSPSNRFQSEKS